MGGLGVPAASALVRAGAERIGLVDPDPVELSNLARQVLYGAASLGRLKVEAAAERLRENHLQNNLQNNLNDHPKLAIETHPVALNLSNAAELIARYGFVIDATDDPSAKFLINDTCLALRRPFVYAGVLGMTGQAMTVLPGRTACLRCLFEDAPEPGEIASCREAGIIGPVAAMIGEIEAAEALRWRGGGVPSGRIRTLAIAPRAGCACDAARRAENPATLAPERNPSRNQ
jgi:molybdopterin/thiamine biosynthesis adenylyltransferase